MATAITRAVRFRRIKTTRNHWKVGTFSATLGAMPDSEVFSRVVGELVSIVEMIASHRTLEDVDR